MNGSGSGFDSAQRLVEMLLEGLEEEAVVLGVGVAGLVNVVERGVDPRRGELQPVLKQKEK